jgi:hypothetical protein
MPADLLARRGGRFPVGVVLIMILLTACSERLSAEPGPSAQVPAPSPSASPPPARPLVDLRKKVKGKVLLHHVADGDEDEWVGKLKVGSSYKIAMDCSGSQGKLAIAISEGFQTLRQCVAGYTTVTLDVYPGKKPKPRTLTVKAPSGASWAVLVAGIS